MRPLKFRIYDKERNIMEEVGAIDWASDGLPITANTETKKYYRPECGESELPLMQFSGLLDKNGKEIYEGDILSGVEFLGKSRIWEAVSLKHFHHWSETEELIEGFGPVEVIGNIHQNPELLK